MHIPKRVWVLTGTMFLTALALSMVYLYMQLHALPTVPKNALNPLIVATHPGTLTLETDVKATTYRANQEITVIVSGNSKDSAVGGYDAVINYDPEMLEFVRAKNEMDDFDFFVTQKTNQVSLTASLKLSSNAAPLTDAILATLSFKTKKEGATKLSFHYVPDVTTDSNMLSDKAKDILGTVQDLELTVGKKITLTLNKPVVFEDKKYTLIEATIPDAACRDCLSVVRVAIEENGKTDILSYKNGGFDGLVEREKSIGAMVYRLEDVSTTSVSLIIGKKQNR